MRDRREGGRDFSSEGVMDMARKRSKRETPEGGLGLKEIKELIDLLKDRQVAEFELEKRGTKIRILRASPAERGANAPLSLQPLASIPESDARFAPPPAAPRAETVEASEDLYIIKSPMVGTFYGSPAPNAPAFVKQGDVVRVGQPLCIIEAMKLMNEIESEVAGEVVRIYVENGQPVEYGESLFAIKPSHKK